MHRSPAAWLAPSVDTARATVATPTTDIVQWRGSVSLIPIAQAKQTTAQVNKLPAAVAANLTAVVCRDQTLPASSYALRENGASVYCNLNRRTAQSVADEQSCRTLPQSLEALNAFKYEPPIVSVRGVEFYTCAALEDARSRVYRPKEEPLKEKKIDESATVRGSSPALSSSTVPGEIHCTTSVICSVCKRNMSPPESGSPEEMCPGHMCTISLKKQLMCPDGERLRCCVRMLRCMLGISSDKHSAEVTRPYCPMCIISQVKAHGYDDAGDTHATSPDICCSLCSSGKRFSTMDVKQIRVVSESDDQAHAPHGTRRRIASRLLNRRSADSHATTGLAAPAASSSARASAAAASHSGSERKPGVPAMAIISRIYSLTATYRKGQMTRDKSEVKTNVLQAEDIAMLCKAIMTSPWCEDVRTLLNREGIPFTPDDYTMDSVIVLPERLRKSYETKNGREIESDFDMHAQLIYDAIQEGKESVIYRCIAEYIGYEQSRAAQGATSGFTGKRVLRSIRQLFGRKGGILRNNLMGRRVNFAARAVIGGSTNIPPDCIGVPRCIASAVTVSVNVCDMNINELEARIHDPVAGARIVRILRVVDPSVCTQSSGCQTWTRPRVENVYFRRDCTAMENTHTRYGVSDETHAAKIYAQMQSHPKTGLHDANMRSKLAASLATTSGDPSMATDAPGMDRESINIRRTIKLEPGYIVERELDDGDMVLFNRQPSLHRLSMMAHRVIIVDGYVLRMNQCTTPPYNADFDGDEMNVHVVQGEHARSEVEMLTGVDGRSLSPASGAALVVPIQDVIVGIAMMTRLSTLICEREARILTSAAGLDPDVDLPPAAICGIREDDVLVSEPVWTGKQILALTMLRPTDPRVQMIREAQNAYEAHVPAGPSIFHDKGNFSVLLRLCSERAAVRSNVDMDNLSATDKAFLETNENALLAELESIAEGTKAGDVRHGVVIRHSEILFGTLTSEEIGKTKNRGLVTAVYKSDARFGIAFVHRACRIAVTWLTRHGFSLGLSDIYVGPEISMHISEIMDKCGSDATLDKLREIVSVLPRARRAERLDSLLCGKYSEACQMSTDLVKHAMRTENSLAVMCAVGSKGSWNSICATGGCVGQQFESGLPIKKKMSGNGSARMTSSIVTAVTRKQSGVVQSSLGHRWARTDREPIAWGVVTSSYAEGLTVDEYVAHHTGSRDSLAGTALKTQESGRMQRNEVKVLESLAVAQDGTVRFPSGQIVQMVYGSDNIDGMRIVQKQVKTLCYQMTKPRNSPEVKLAALEIAASRLVHHTMVWQNQASKDYDGRLSVLATIVVNSLPNETVANVIPVLNDEVERLIDCMSWAADVPIAAKFRAFKKKQDEAIVPTDVGVVCLECIAEITERPCTTHQVDLSATHILKRIDEVVNAARACYGYLTSVKIEWNLLPLHLRNDAKFVDSWIPYPARPFIAHLRESLTIAELVTRTFVSADMTFAHLCASGFFELLCQRIVERLVRAFDAPGEMVGLICADSNSETLMQLTLNAFHQAGSFVRVTATGLPRMDEITGLTPNQRTPIVTVCLREKYLPLLADNVVQAVTSVAGLSLDGANALDALIKYVLIGRRLADLIDRASVHKTVENVASDSSANVAENGCIHPADEVMLEGYNIFPEPPMPGCTLSQTALRLSFRARMIHDLCPDAKYEEVLWNAIRVASVIIRAAIQAKDATTGKMPIAYQYYGAVCTVPNAHREHVGMSAKKTGLWMRVAQNFGCPLMLNAHGKRNTEIDSDEFYDDGKTYVAIIRFCISTECTFDERMMAENHLRARLLEVLRSKRFRYALVTGTPGITEANYMGVDPECPMSDRTNVILTGQPGSVISSLLSSSQALDLLDPDTVTSNDLNGIREMYGIEAARRAIIDELACVHGLETYVDSRHITFIADAMTYSGDSSPLNANHERMHRSAIARATHERPCQELVIAGLAREDCQPNDRSTALVLGSQEPRYGSCLSDVYFSMKLAASFSKSQTEVDSDVSDRETDVAPKVSLDTSVQARTIDKVLQEMRRFDQHTEDVSRRTSDVSMSAAYKSRRTKRDREISEFRTKQLICFTDENNSFGVKDAARCPVEKKRVVDGGISPSWKTTAMPGWQGEFITGFNVSKVSFTPLDGEPVDQEGYDPEQPYKQFDEVVGYCKNSLALTVQEHMDNPVAFAIDAANASMEAQKLADAHSRVPSNISYADEY